MKTILTTALFFATVAFAEDANHPSLFLEKGEVFVEEEFDGEAPPQTIELRGGSAATMEDGVMVVINEVVIDNPIPRPVIHYKPILEEFICHMRIRLDGADYKPKQPWLDIGGQHRNHFRFEADQVLFSSETKSLAERTIDNSRPGNMLPLNEWLYVTVEIEKGRIALSINGKTQTYEGDNIETGEKLQLGIKAIPEGKLHVDYIRIWKKGE
ncbi:MAG: hypothetical protein AAF357_17840 [Verrucomicrobiota bacterium]